MKTQSIRRIPVFLGALALLASLLASPAAAFVDQDRGQAWRDWGIGQHVGTPSKDSNGMRIPGRYIVVFKDSIRRPAALAAKQADEVGGKVSIVYRAALKGYAAAMSRADAATLRSDNSVRYVVPDRLVEVASQTMPAGANRIGVPENSSLAVNGEEDVQVDADIAIIDTGVDYENSDLNVVARTDCVPAGEGLIDPNKEEEEYEGCEDEQGRDVHGHGTHVAGIAAALDNSEGIVGAAPGARIWSVRAFNKHGIGWGSWILSGIDWVTEHGDQIEVANMSFGCKCSAPAREDAIKAAAEGGLVSAVAAGNKSADAKDFSPAKNPYAITVSATTVPDPNTDELKPTVCAAGEDTLTSFSNYGEVVDVAAPGTCIYSTQPDGEYRYLQGTSMAAPHVAGAAAILASRENPEGLEDVEAIRQEIEEEGSEEWTDTSPDGITEPLLDIRNTSVFQAKGHPVTQPATVQSESKVTLRGLVNPEGVSASYHLEYGTTLAYGSKVPASPKSIGSGTKYVSVEEPLEGLQGQTLYHYRVVVTSTAGTFYGNDETFSTTPPEATEQSASDVSANGATLNATVDPKGIATTYQFEYGKTKAYGHRRPVFPQSIGTEKTEIHEEVGFLSGNETYHYRLVLQTAAGVVFGEDDTFTTPEPALVREAADESTPASRYELRDVSCISATFCMAVGGYDPPVESNGAPLAERWDGEEWSQLPAPDPAPPNNFAFFSGVSCTSPSWCVAVGYSSGTDANLVIQKWDGSQWSEWSLPAIQVGNAQPLKVSCASPSECMMVATGIGTGEGSYGLAGRWNGTGWSFENVVEPAQTWWSILRSVSCPTVSSCVAVGTYDTTSEKFAPSGGPLAVYWDGEEWSVIQSDAVNPGTETPRPLHSVSCVTPELCMVAVGRGEKVERWDGESWSVEAVPKPAGITPSHEGNTESTGISCRTATSCALVGSYGEERSYSSKSPLLAPRLTSWSGEEWAPVSVSGPVEHAPGSSSGSFSNLHGVSCGTPTNCVAVGNYADNTALIERLLRPIATTEKATGVASSSATLNGTVNPRGKTTTYQFEYDTTEYKEGEEPHGTKAPAAPKSIGSGSKDVAVSETIEGLEPDTTYHFRVVATNAAGTTYGKDQSFTANGVTFAVNGTPVPLGAKIHGVSKDFSFNWAGGPSSCPTAEFNFEVGQQEEDPAILEILKYVEFPSTCTGGELDLTVTKETFELLNEPQQIQFFADGTTNNFDSKFKFTAEEPGGPPVGTCSASGTGSESWTESSLVFSHPGSAGVCGNMEWGGKFALSYLGEPVEIIVGRPLVTTEAASNVKPSEATLNATVNPNGRATTYQFEYGTTTEYGSKAPASPKSIGAGGKDVAVSETIEGLEPGTTYHFRVVATNAAGTSYGKDRSFTAHGVTFAVNGTPVPLAAKIRGVSENFSILSAFGENSCPTAEFEFEVDRQSEDPAVLGASGGLKYIGFPSACPGPALDITMETFEVLNEPGEIQFFADGSTNDFDSKFEFKWEESGGGQSGTCSGSGTGSESWTESSLVFSHPGSAGVCGNMEWGGKFALSYLGEPVEIIVE